MNVLRDNIDTTIWGESTGEIRIGDVHIPTPYPVITSTDINYASVFSREYKIPVSYQNQIHESKRRWSEKFIKELTDSTRKVKKETDWIDAQLMRAKDSSKAELCFYTPLVAQTTRITKNIIEMSADVQLESEELPTVSIIDSKLLPQSEITEIVKRIAKQSINAGKEPFLVTNTAFDEKVFSTRMALAKEHCAGVTAIYSNPVKHSQNFQTLANSKEENFLRFISNVDRRYPKRGKWNLVPLPLLVADIVSPNLGIGGGKETKKEIVAKEQTNSRRLHHDCFGQLTIAEHNDTYHQEPDCPCPVDKGNELNDLAIEYKGHLNEAFRTHEPYVIFDAVEQAREKIGIGKFIEEFVNNRKYLKEAYETLFRQRNLTTLAGW